MSSRRHIGAGKDIISDTGWRNGSIPRKNAPFFKALFPLSNSWYWREATLQAYDDDRIEYRLLIMMRFDKPNFKSWLSLKTPEGYALVCRYEAHNDHGGLHCHYICGEEHYPLGEIDPALCYTIPEHSKTRRKKLGRISLNEAWQLSLKFYRIGIRSAGSLL